MRAILEAKVSSRLPNAEKIREDVLSEVGELLAADGTGEQPDELDFYECRFNSAFRALRIDVLTRELAEMDPPPICRTSGTLGEPDTHEDAFARMSEAFQTPATQQSTLFLEELWKAINALPPDERQAVILVHIMGYDESLQSEQGDGGDALQLHGTDDLQSPVAVGGEAIPIQGGRMNPAPIFNAPPLREALLRASLANASPTPSCSMRWCGGFRSTPTNSPISRSSLRLTRCAVRPRPMPQKPPSTPAA